MTKRFEGLLGLFGIAMTLAWPFGILHAGFHHGGGRTVLAVVLPPYGAYLAVESLFHNEATTYRS